MWKSDAFLYDPGDPWRSIPRPPPYYAIPVNHYEEVVKNDATYRRVLAGTYQLRRDAHKRNLVLKGEGMGAGFSPRGAFFFAAVKQDGEIKVFIYPRPPEVFIGDLVGYKNFLAHLFLVAKSYSPTRRTEHVRSGILSLIGGAEPVVTWEDYCGYAPRRSLAPVQSDPAFHALLPLASLVNPGTL